MKPFYSIIRIAPSPSTGDTLSVGLLLCYEDKYILKFSEDKIRIAKALIGEQAESIDFIEKHLKKFVTSHNESRLRLQNSLFEGMNINTLLSPDYFSYLSNYSNGILQFSKPSFIEEKVITEEKFISLNRNFQCITLGQSFIEGRSYVLFHNSNIIGSIL